MNGTTESDAVQRPRPIAAAGGTSGAPAAPGLSNAHISPQKSKGYSFQFHIGGTLAQLKGFGTGTGGGKRARITGFSRNSRRRLMRLMASLNEPEVAQCRQLLTLTYPGRFTHDGREWKRHLDNLIKRLRRCYDIQAIVWKLEPQKRGAPHYHLLVFSESPVCRQWLAHAWYEIVGSERPEHLRAGTQCDHIHSWQGVLSYAAKYIGKVVDDGGLPEFWNTAGRWWGVRGDLPIEQVEQPLTRKQFVRLRRVVRRFIEKRIKRPIKLPASNHGLTAYLDCTHALRLLSWVVQCRQAATGSEHLTSSVILE